MRLRLTIWNIEAKLLFVVLLEALPFPLIGAIAAGEIAFLFRFSLAASFKLVGAAAAAGLAMALYHNLWSVFEDACDAPLREPLRAWPELEKMARDVALEVRRPAPDAAVFLLSLMVWRRFGCDPARFRERTAILIPVSCLAVWPVLGLRCHIGHALVRRRPKAWLFWMVRRSLTRLSQESRPGSTLRSRPTKATPFRGLYFKLAVNWNLLADMEADAHIARVFGGSAVATWLCQTQLAVQVAPPCLQRIIQPAAERGVLLPIAASCAAFYSLIEPGWLAMVEGERVKAQRSKPGNPFLQPLLLRLALLPGGPGSVHDPRPAAGLLPSLDSLEERLLRHEAALGRRNLRRAAFGEIGETVLLPMMREEVERNAATLQGRSIADLPDLVQDMPALAAEYRPDPHYLPAFRQRQALVPGLLAAFLAVELARTGWRAGYAVPPGLTLERNGRTLCPHLVVAALRKGDMSRTQFLELVDLEPSA